ncbi:MAG: hypothetical protein QOG09_306 [Solirubrobacterales bacterium]|jgi:hypothetical protein|nr:hypothetical protein [Solirubrobacterales bacterium]MDX6662204.1 hypothetical protein [Solirubrobacterales bacterium]
MTSRTRATRLAVLIALIAVAVVLFVVLKSDSRDSKSSSPPGTQPGSVAKVATVTVRGAKPVGGIQKLTFQKGGRVRFEVVSDIADEIHVHGYDLMKDVPAGGSVSFDFPAAIDGVFEVELEGRKQQIAELTVQP